MSSGGLDRSLEAALGDPFTDGLRELRGDALVASGGVARLLGVRGRLDDLTATLGELRLQALYIALGSRSFVGREPALCCAELLADRPDVGLRDVRERLAGLHRDEGEPLGACMPWANAVSVVGRLLWCALRWKAVLATIGDQAALLGQVAVGVDQPCVPRAGGRGRDCADPDRLLSVDQLRARDRGALHLVLLVAARIGAMGAGPAAGDELADLAERGFAGCILG